MFSALLTIITRQVYNLFQEPVKQPLLGVRIAEEKPDRHNILKASGAFHVQTSGNRNGLILPDFYVVWTLFTGFGVHGVIFGIKKQNFEPGKNCPQTCEKKKV